MKFLFIISIYGLLVFTFNKIIRKWLKVEKKKLFSYNHLNRSHKKIDWTIRIASVFILIISSIINIYRTEKLWILESYVLVFLFIIVSETVRAVMEWRYAENKNDYLYTMIQLAFVILFLLMVYNTNLFGLV
ncbi:DUF4181 domain-containing protein [Bacillus sp. E(2018)]|uniref:DUF4181 domain-containing protein n=1 Tax=Bacillus sp. E(2018) TaxID=2502239 RepID=UPI00256FC652|nr:DUF4181 domain-containing protein [Bacillus sp. E(2018)]